MKRCKVTGHEKGGKFVERYKEIEDSVQRVSISNLRYRQNISRDLLYKPTIYIARAQIETSSNIPFLAGELQSNKYDFLVVAPTRARRIEYL